MKKKWLKTGVVVSLLLGILSLAFSAAAEENGYWTMKTDESGNPVMIYTCTKPVDWVITEDADIRRGKGGRAYGGQFPRRSADGQYVKDKNQSRFPSSSFYHSRNIRLHDDGAYSDKI